MLHNIVNANDTHKYTIGLFLDLKKAFDTIQHDILIEKLKHYGIRSLCLNWITSYLSNRQQYTYVNGCSSSFQNVICGVPQGSTLGPLLFLISINDLVNASEILNLILFADDTNAFYSDTDINRLNLTINTELAKINNWLLVNKLSLNMHKTHYLIFTRKRVLPQITIKIGEVEIPRESHTKFLGVIVDDKLSWKEHAKYVCKKISKSVGIINKIKNNINPSAKIILYYSLVYPYLQYCNVAWGSASNETLKPLTIVQKRIIRIISAVSYYQHTQPLFKDLIILKLADVHKLESLKFVFNQLNCSHPIIRFYRASDKHNRQTRNMNDLRPERPMSNYSKRFIAYNGCVLWNNLPASLKKLNNAITFKINVKKYLINCY